MQHVPTLYNQLDIELNLMIFNEQFTEFIG